MEDLNENTLQTSYFKVVDIWKSLCEKHNELLDLTCSEYSLLLENKVDELDIKITEKESLIKIIAEIENERRKLINQVSKENNVKLDSVSELISFFTSFEERNNQKHLYRFNALLIAIIEKIQEQNKKNQYFLNKALLSLKDIRETLGGKKSFNTYSSNGASKPGRTLSVKA